MTYQEVMRFLVDIGLVDVVLPFILVFTITYSVLQRTRVLGEEDKKPKKRLNAMMAFVLGFFAVLATNLLNVINVLIAYLVLLMIVGLLLAIVMGLSGAEGGYKNRFFAAIMIILFALFVFYGLARAGIIDEQRFFSTLFWPVVVLIASGAVLYFVLRKKPAAAQPRQQKGATPQPRTSAEEF
ncbi:MAG: hypothetical protein QW165_03255 [Candidatus Woesearchaeota archaeon]